MDVKPLILDINNMFIVITFWDHGNMIRTSFSSSFFDKVYIDTQKRIRISTKQLHGGEFMIIQKDSKSEEFFNISREYFNDNLANMMKYALRRIFSGLELKCDPNSANQYLPNNHYWFLEPHRREYKFKDRNLSILIFGVDPEGYKIWCPSNSLFEEMDEYIDIPDNDFIPMTQNATQLELDLF